MKKDLTLYETRVVGVLLEKEITTPDQYPLSLNALVNACNQKSNRHPVLELDEATVRQTLEALQRKDLVKGSSYGSRVEKYHHRFCNTEFGELKLDAQQVAVVCELLLRGPQTPGELRSRASRMAEFSDVQATESTLKRLLEHKLGPLVVMLPREPGKRESRYMHMFSSDIEPVETAAPSDSGSISAYKAKITDLEVRLEALQEENDALKKKLRQLGQVV
ncbi:uncharacterized protein conserved in bacteria [Hahella chejuensis KCTC 2396]|uniref:UPF0502 protein HCH_06091 n=1 Tax=Hahella chejuensis (strain KCTC 2396) TaxID=349521 RepID=Y6091_HAHCH|nr:DUF480 domain-containing protein [Hahella chejuensis]Q2S9D5.1 RecName: Full=UPF0502 protein HCH_06091 [Hahella chejuensis KCTC 2396]ABC32739.1 uncharacterized protein conserved in bacteria [Hahella chejuensis KCTC 2396]